MPGAVITFQTLVKNNYPTRPHHLGYAYATEQAPVQKKKKNMLREPRSFQSLEKWLRVDPGARKILKGLLE